MIMATRLVFKLRVIWEGLLLCCAAALIPSYCKTSFIYPRGPCVYANSKIMVWRLELNIFLQPNHITFLVGDIMFNVGNVAF